MITGFQAQLKVDDGGTGAAFGGASTAFSGLATFEIPELAAEKFDATELDQKDGASPDPYMRELPTGLIKQGTTKCEQKYTKANYQRLVSLLQRGRGYTFVITAPDDQTTPGTPVVMTVTQKGWVSKVDEVKFEKSNPVMIPFEITWEDGPAVT